MDYYQIGQRVRKYRKAQGLSQEELAARVGISVTHMSHIETGNTKLSLPVLVELADTLDRCTAQQLRILTDIVKAAKISLDKYQQP